MEKSVSNNDLANAVMAGLKEYADLATDDMKKAVKKAGSTVCKEIQQNAPKDTGDYAKSWAVKNMRETSNSLEITVYSKNRYQLAHLLEFGHAKRGGGRVSGKVHNALAEEKGIRELEDGIEKALEESKWMN